MSSKMKKNTPIQLKQTAFNFDFPESEIQPKKNSDIDTKIKSENNSAIVEKVEFDELPEPASILAE